MATTLEDEQWTSTDDRLQKPKNPLLPEDIIEDILSRLPVKSILRFRSVSKPWLSLISNPSFTKLQTTRATVDHRTALFLSAHDRSTGERYFFTGPRDGGSLTCLMRFDSGEIIQDEQYLNGLIYYTSWDHLSWDHLCGKRCAFLLNPSTRKFFKISTSYGTDTYYFFGFDETSYEHKILKIRPSDFQLIKPSKIKIMIFYISSYSWREMLVHLPVDLSGIRWSYGPIRSVCVNSVIYLMLTNPVGILAFDLTTNKFFIVKIPVAEYTFDVLSTRFIKINGVLAVLCKDVVKGSSERHIWILQDYEKRVWVRKTIWLHGDATPLDCNPDEIILSKSMFYDGSIYVTMYNIKNRWYEISVFALSGYRFLHPEIGPIKCYVESMIPLQNDPIIQVVPLAE